MTEKTREALRAALFEAAFVVFGIVVALAAKLSLVGDNGGQTPPNSQSK